jgi:hypothetical protein
MARGAAENVRRTEDAETSNMNAEKSCKGFKQIIADAIEVVEAERKAQEEREQAENMRLEKARQKAMMVREIIVVPLLNELRDNMAAAGKEVLPQWQVQPAADGGNFFGTATTPNLGPGGPPCYTIKAEASVGEHGAALDLSVVCFHADPTSTSTSRVPPLYDKRKSMQMLKFDELGAQIWFQEQLEECARMCVLTRMRQLVNDNVQRVAEAAVAT